MRIEIESIGESEARRRGFFGWPSSTRPVSRYTWHYDAQETAYIEAGNARIETEDGNVEVEQGDLITLPSNLDCTWVIREPLTKRYQITDRAE